MKLSLLSRGGGGGGVMGECYQVYGSRLLELDMYDKESNLFYI